MIKTISFQWDKETYTVILSEHYTNYRVYEEIVKVFIWIYLVTS